MIDFHCHLDLYPDPAQVSFQCQVRKIYVLSVTTTPSAWRGTNDLVQGNDKVKVALGLHPELAHERKGELKLFDELLPETRYVGEVGLDGSPRFQLNWQDQLEVFEHVLASCRRRGGRIISIHSRQAVAEVLDCLQRHTSAGIPILHWFSGKFSELDRAISQGCWFSIGPVMILSPKGRALIARMPRNRVLTESDGPFTQLQTHTLFPWDTSNAIDELAKLWGFTPEEAYRTVCDNLRLVLKLI